MKKLILTTAAAVGAMMIAASGAQAEFTFALVPKNMNNPFFDQARDGCMKAQEESKGAFKCMYIGPGEHGGGDEQVTIVQDLVAKGVDGIAVSPSNAAAMAGPLQAAKDAGIPVTVAKDAGSPVNAASILGVIALGVEQGDYVTLTADGEGAESTLDTLAELLTTDHDAEA